MICCWNLDFFLQLKCDQNKRIITRDHIKRFLLHLYINQDNAGNNAQWRDWKGSWISIVYVSKSSWICEDRNEHTTSFLFLSLPTPTSRRPAFAIVLRTRPTAAAETFWMPPLLDPHSHITLQYSTATQKLYILANTLFKCFKESLCVFPSWISQSHV